MAQMLIVTTAPYTDPVSGLSVPVGAAINRVLTNDGDTAPPGTEFVAEDGRQLWNPPPPIPQSVDMWQLKVALAATPSKVGCTTALADATNAAATAGGVAEITWTGAPTVSRTSPLLNAMAPQIGFTEADLDALLWRRPAWWRDNCVNRPSIMRPYHFFVPSLFGPWATVQAFLTMGWRTERVACQGREMT